MFGRYQLHTSPPALALAMGLHHPPEIRARHNIAPTQQVPIVRLTKDTERDLSQVRLGFRTFGAKGSSIGNKMIKGAPGLVVSRPGCRDPHKKARCLILASGSDEWAQ